MQRKEGSQKERERMERIATGSINSTYQVNLNHFVVKELKACDDISIKAHLVLKFPSMGTVHLFSRISVKMSQLYQHGNIF